MKGINPKITQIANSPAAKLAAKLASSPAAKAAMQMTNNPMVKAATQMANNPMVQAAARISRIAQPYAEALQKLSHIEWIGKIPKHWGISKLWQMFNERKCKNYNNKETNVLSLSYGKIKQRDVSNNMGLLPESFETYNIVTPDNIVLRLTDLQNDHKSLRCGLVTEHGIITSAYVTLEQKRPLCANYFYKLLHSYDVMQVFYNMGDGVRQSLKYSGELSKMPLLIPPLSEQQAIADYLDGECARIDGIVTTQRQIIERLKEYKKSVITEAVTRGLNPDAPMKDSGIDWIGKIPEHWEVRRIKTLGEYRNGLTYNPENMVDESNGTLVLRSSNIQNGKIVLDDNVFVNTIIPEQLLVHKGDIIICSRNGSRELVGKNALIKEDIMASFGAFMMIFRTNYPEYISYILNSAIFSYYLSTFFTATINQLTGSNFGNMQIVFCPDLNEQQEIIDYLDGECARIDTIIEKRERMIELMTEYKKSLIYECVTGKKEIVDVVE